MYSSKDLDLPLKTEIAEVLLFSSDTMTSNRKSHFVSKSGKNLSLAESICKKNNTSLDMDSIVKGNGPKPTEKAEVLE